MQYLSLYLCFIVLLLGACNGSPAPETLAPTPSKPIFFKMPSNNQLVEADEPVDVRISLDSSQQFTAVTLFADDREVRLLELNENTWGADPLDDVLLTFAPGEHTLTAYAETEDGSSFTRVITLYAKLDSPAAPTLPNESRITNIKMLNVDNGIVYANFDPLGGEVIPEIPIEDLDGEEIEFQVSYEGDIYSMLFYGSALKEDVYLYGQESFNFSINSSDEEYSFGLYRLNILAYRSVGGDLIGQHATSVGFRVLNSQLKVKTRTVSLAQSLNDVGPAEAKILIENLGNRIGEYQFLDVPDWLTLSRAAGSVEPGESITVTASAPACTEALLQSTVLNVLADGKETEILVTRECVDGPLYDLSLDRFYFNQAIPANDSLIDSETSDIELVAGRMGIARAFVATNDDSDFRLPVVQLHYRMADGQEGVYDLVGPAAVPKTIYEGLLEQTFNAVLPEWFFEPGNEFYVVVDPNNEITERLENNNRYPREGYMPLIIRDVPPLKITLVPMVKSGSVEIPELLEDSIPVLMQKTMALMPLKDYDITIREQPFVFTRGTWVGALSELDALRQADNAEGLYFGIVKDAVIEGSEYAGYAKINGKAALSLPVPSVIAHELGHNFGLKHVVACKSPLGPDLNYPHEGAQINLWGYNIFSGFLKAPDDRDFMSYCPQEWISAYHYRKILLKRGGELFPVATTVQEQKTSTQAFDVEQELLMISGSIEGPLAEIHHAYRTVGVEKPAASASPYTLKLLSEGGGEVYRGKLDVTATSHSSEQLFTATIPAWKLNAEVARVIIEFNGTVYLDKAWSPLGATLLDQVHSNISVARIDANRVRIRWQANSDTTLWVTDSQTGNIVAIDASGDIIVYSRSALLEFKYTYHGFEIIERVPVVD